MQKLTVKEIADIIGVEEYKVNSICGIYIRDSDLSYTELTSNAKDDVILKVLNRIDNPTMSVAGKSKLPIWEVGWGENLSEFIASDYDVNTLVPKYLDNRKELRFKDGYIIPSHNKFLLNFTNIIREWLFETYLSSYQSIYEFGCGPAIHLAYLANKYPNKVLYGLDWAKASQDIISILHEKKGYNITGYNFDLFNPSIDIYLEDKSAVYTWNSLEQIGDKFEPFLEYLLNRKPGIVINVEGLTEFYDVNTLSGHLANKYTQRRNYLTGYLSRLQDLQDKGVINILKTNHTKLSDLYDDTLSYVVWEPK